MKIPSSRRSILSALATVSLRCLAIIACLASVVRAAPAAPTAAAPGISHGPILGNVTSHSVRVWARTRSPASFRVRYSRFADLREATRSAPATTVPGRDFTGWIELTGLTPDTRYYYAVEVDSRPEVPHLDSQIDSFRTLPSAEAFRDPQRNPKGIFNFSFEVGSCNRQLPSAVPPGQATDAIYATMLARLKDKIHFHILNGDWIYEECATWPWRGQKAREVTADEWARANGLPRPPPAVELMHGITGVWENYKLYLTRGADMARFHRAIPLFVMFDDHEIYNDVVGAGEVGLRTDSRGPLLSSSPYIKETPGNRVPDGTVFRPFQRNHDAEVERSVFRDPALQAWSDYLGWANPDIGVRQPIHFGTADFHAASDLLIDPRADFRGLDLAKSGTLHVHWGQGNSGVYEIEQIIDRHTLRIRPGAAVTEPARYSIGTNHYTKFRIGNCDFYLVDTRSFRTLHDKKNPHNERTSMLGRRQLEWLTTEMQRSDADFLFVVSSVSVTIAHDNKAARTNDSKDESWTSHAAERDRLLDFFDTLRRPVFMLTGDIHNSFVVQIGPKVWEFLCGPHMSPSHYIVDMESVPLSGPYVSRGRPVTIKWGTGFLDDAPRRANPKYCVVQVNNAYNSPDSRQNPRWIAYDVPQVVFQYYDGLTGDLLYAEAVSAR